MSTEGLAEFQERYGALVVAACEWRAMQAEPESLADRVFAVLRDQPAAPDLFYAFRAIDRVVFDSYVEYADRRSILDRLRSPAEPLPNAPRDGKREALQRDAITRLRARDRDVLQLAYWDELAESELATVLRADVEAVRERLARACANYTRLVTKKDPALDPSGITKLFRALKPGTRTRWQ